MPDINDPLGNLGDEYRETRVRTRRVVRRGGDLIYEADIETVRDNDQDGVVRETHAGGIVAACGCLIGGDVKPRFHRDGTAVCAAHFYWCSVCLAELLPLHAVAVDKRVYCRACGEEAIDEVLYTERKNPGTFDRPLLAHLKIQKRNLQALRWQRTWNRLRGRLLGGGRG